LYSSTKETLFITSLEENRNPSILKRKTADAEGLELLSKDERKERSPRG